MSDLISRAEVMNIIQEELSLRCGHEADIALFSVKKKVSELPTAFDTEKVVEQIHDKYCHKCRNILGKQSSEEYCKSVKCEIDALCDIVKKGGVE